MRVADQLAEGRRARRQIKSAMIYPMLVIIFAVGVMMALCAFLVPVFVGVFKEFGGELPAITQVSVFLSEVVTGYWWRCSLVTGAVDRSRSSSGRKRPWGRQAVGSLPPAHADEDRHDRAAGRGRALVAHAGLADSRRRAAAAGARDHRPHGRQRRGRGSDGRRDRLRQAGGTIAAPLAQAPIFPSMVTHMVGVGEETGALDAMLDRVAEFYEEQVEASVKALTSILEPIMIIVIGVDRRLHRDLDVPAAIRSLQPHRILSTRGRG